MSIPSIIAKVLRLIFLKWYTYICGSILVITFFVFQGLQKAGVIELYRNSVAYGFHQSALVAKNCTPLIRNLKDFAYCVQNPEAFNNNNSNNDTKMMNYISTPANIGLEDENHHDVNYDDNESSGDK